jgi:hypothetical protein
MRLWAAVLLCIAPLGLVWSTRGVDSRLVSQSPVRLFLVVAALVLAFCAGRPRTDRTRTLARAAVGALAIAAAFAAAAGASQVLVCVLAALATVVPAVTGRAAGTTRFGARPPSRVK